MLQMRGSVFVHGDENDSSLFTENGTVTKYVRGDLPETLTYEGRTYQATGGGHSVNGDDTKYSYVPVV